MVHEVIIITGVSGSGKTTLGQYLSIITGWPFYDGDDFHPHASLVKMSNGVPLDDDDRLPWLLSINSHIAISLKQGSIIIACSALTDNYRHILVQGFELQRIKWVHLQGDFELIKERMNSRQHYMPVGLLQSQFDTYQKPSNGLVLNATNSIKEWSLAVQKHYNIYADIGVVGMGVMGSNIARNFCRNGFRTSLYNRTVATSEEKVAWKVQAKYGDLFGSLAFDELSYFVQSLSVPRKIWMMIPAGEAVDHFIDNLMVYCQPGDIIIDAGNSHYTDTERRVKKLNDLGLTFIGIGVSGGEEGAYQGPAIMPGGGRKEFDSLSPMFETIAAKSTSGHSSCHWVGHGGAGHFVKMVHNGIEYAEMQLIAEVVSILKSSGFEYEVIAEILESWDDVSSYLLEITIRILQTKNSAGKHLIDQILDVAGNKGTGSWTTIAACDLGVPIPTLTAGLFARYMSTFWDVRQVLSQTFPAIKMETSQPDILSIKNLYQWSRIINHHQGFHLISAASKEYKWEINMANLASTWTAGCIIRSKLMDDISNHIETANEVLQIPKLSNWIKVNFETIQLAYQKSITMGVAMPCITASASYYQYMIQSRSDAYMIQAQRDYFGAHTYRLIDDPTTPVHTDWNKS